jgi:hypothetical protein
MSWHVLGLQLQNRYQLPFPDSGYSRTIPEGINDFYPALKLEFNHFFRSFGHAKRVNRSDGL